MGPVRRPDGSIALQYHTVLDVHVSGDVCMLVTAHVATEEIKR